jgi:branched-chain amino acid transport system substrate-binding protein
LAATADYKGVTGPITFDEKGDIKNGALTLEDRSGGSWKLWLLFAKFFED